MAKRPDAEKMADEEAIVCFFAGDGTNAPRYPKHNSREEKNARAAMARRVRDFMQGFSAEMIALAIDPDTPSRIPGLKPLRKIRFESVARGKASTWRRDLRVADFIRREIGKSDQPRKGWRAEGKDRSRARIGCWKIRDKPRYRTSDLEATPDNARCQ